MYQPGYLKLPSIGNLTVEDRKAVALTLEQFGCLVVDLERPEPSLSCAEALSRLGRQFGKPVRHRLSDALGVHPIRNIANYPEYANTTNAELNLHTDGAFEESPPKVMLIYCERPSDRGGNTRLCSGHSVYEHIKQQDPGALSPLFRDDAFFIRRDDKQGSRPVFRLVDGRVQMAYRYGRDILVEINPACERGFVLIENFLADPLNFLEFKLKPHQTLIFDNTRILHGRTAFPAEDERSLYGLWCDGSGPDCAGFPFGFEP
jgi:alpha-ketoglutarate-dependent taurine dioxygenase